MRVHLKNCTLSICNNPIVCHCPRLALVEQLIVRELKDAESFLIASCTDATTSMLVNIINFAYLADQSYGQMHWHRWTHSDAVISYHDMLHGNLPSYYYHI